jgi:hypothetical protein
MAATKADGEAAKEEMARALAAAMSPAVWTKAQALSWKPVRGKSEARPV